MTGGHARQHGKWGEGRTFRRAHGPQMVVGKDAVDTRDFSQHGRFERLAGVPAKRREEKGDLHELAPSGEKGGANSTSLFPKVGRDDLNWRTGLGSFDHAFEVTPGRRNE